ncbi:serine-rich adhesin for platelets isoform X2 [Prorops nasuta]|uniref:serine-rich adhesin for platelets isoform X2 n=1 Tax=Prorops nasuta TaxID=863751 RepID=UPI0034CE7E77
MSTQCNRFIQNAWKKELCSNCFKLREEHAEAEDTLRINVVRASTNLRADHLKVQGILRGKIAIEKVEKKKNVAFPDSLTEVIGYGGDDFFSDGDEDDDQGESLTNEEDIIPDSEEERALGNLTRANTNFNTITANLNQIDATDDSNKSLANTVASKSFAPLMLGRIQKDPDGKKTTLLVSVTPFGGDDSIPTAKRPIDRKIKTEVALKSTKKVEIEAKKDERSELRTDSSCLEKIVDMPLITSSNLISVIQRSESPISDDIGLEKTSDRNMELGKMEKKMNVISRTPAIRRAENETAMIQQGSTGSKSDYGSSGKIARRIEKKDNSANKGIELTLTPLKKEKEEAVQESDRTTLARGKDINKITVVAAENKSSTRESESPEGIRRVEGQDIINLSEEMERSQGKKFTFEESRELAGEPDGKADEEDVSEPPALPKSPPPIDSRPPVQGESNKVSIVTTEPRVSFLHGGSTAESRIKPLVPQKPLAFIAKAIPKTSTIQDKGAKNGFKKNSSFGHYAALSISEQNIANRSSTGENNDKNQLVNRKDKVAASQMNLSLTTAQEKIYQFSANNIKGSFSPSEQGTKMDQSNNTAKRSPTIGKLDSGATRLQLADGRDTSSNADSEEDNAAEAQASNATELIRSPNKRRMAPRPPASENIDDLPQASSLFARNPGASLKSDSPVVREKEKRERASSCSPKFRKAICEVPDPDVAQTPDTTSRRNISLSQDSLANGTDTREEKKRGRPRFSLKRFLRMGSRKDVDMTCGHNNSAKADEIPSTPQPKPRLEIIHPLELDGAAVEVVGNDRVARNGEDQTDSAWSRPEANKTPRSSLTSGPPNLPVRPGKPPPPPRNQSLEDWSRLDSTNKPVRPPPPRAETKLPPRAEKSASASWQPSSTTSASTSTTTSDSIYANLGEVRSALAPSKPQRTASMRDQTASHQPIVKKHPTHPQDNGSDYEVLGTEPPPTSDSPTSSDSHVYECLSSSPECDSNLELRHGGGPHSRVTSKRKSDSSALEPTAEFKFHQAFARSTSLPYCGSETESEIYSPYCFYTGDEGPEEDQDWKSKDDELRVSRLRQRRGRSIVHRSLEDNYGAVVVANHEALAQFLEQLNQVGPISGALRGLKSVNPRLSDFNLDISSPVFVGKRIFYSATWNDQSVTLCIAFDLAMHVSRKEFYLAPIIEFIDRVPEKIVDKAQLQGIKSMEATITVLPPLQVSTISGFGKTAKDSSDEAMIREASLVLLQFVNALKSLQARGIEEAPRNLSNSVLCREDKDAYYRLYLLQGFNIDTSDDRTEEMVSLCQCALSALQELTLSNKLPLIQELLIREKAVTLSQVKSVLEFYLWGPADLSLGGLREREISLQRWLDLERANVLHALVRTRAPLTVTDEYQLLFLVRTSAKIMCEASLLLDEQRNRLARAC